MELSLKNIGKIDTASVLIDGITIIAGENNTGKSTVGRALFSVFSCFNDIEEKVRLEREESVGKIVDIICRNVTHRWTHAFRDLSKHIAHNIIARIDLFRNDAGQIRDEVLRSIIRKDEEYSSRLNIDEDILRIKELLNVSDADIFRSVLKKKLDAEFNGQINNIFSDSMGEIRLQIQDEHMVVTVKENSVIAVEDSISLHTEAIYLDDPFVLDDSQYFPLGYNPDYTDHRTYLKYKLLFGMKQTNVVEEIVINNKFEKIYSIIASVCSGDLVRNKQTGFDYRKKNSDKILDVRNLSTGLKTFAILKILLQNGIIEYNGTIILDEPEIHLHPEWQLLFAELIVLLHREFSMHILLNTHSPYFLRAIQVYSARYKVADKCKYYLSEVTGDYANISDVTDDVEKIYFKLARPLQQIEDERWQDD